MKQASFPIPPLSFNKAKPTLLKLDRADLSQGTVLLGKNLAKPLDSVSHQNTQGPLAFFVRFSYDSLFGFLFLDFVLPLK